MIGSFVGLVSIPILALWLHNATELQPIETAIEYLVDDYYQLEQDQRGVDWGIHPLVDDVDMRQEIALAVARAAHKHRIDPMLLLAVAWRESKLSPDVASLRRTGDSCPGGCLGLMQLHGVAVKNCDLSTIVGQFDCGADWQSKAIDWCDGDVFGGLARYMQGWTCDPKRRGRLWRKTRSRIRLQARLQKVVTDAR